MLEILKRDGKKEKYNEKKVVAVLKKVFKGQKSLPADFDLITKLIAKKAEETKQTLIEANVMENIISMSLMESGFFEEAKAYILFKQKKKELSQAREELLNLLDLPKEYNIASVLKDIQKTYTDDVYSLTTLMSKYSSFNRMDGSPTERLDYLARAACELVSIYGPKWEFIAGKILNCSFETNLKSQLETMGIHSFFDKINYLTEQGLYGDFILKNYSKAELELASTFINNKRNDLLTHSSLDLLRKRYVIRNRNNDPIETVQEMFLGVALHLAMPEKQETRMDFVKNIYDILSKLEVTMATPTLANARKPFHQLSSCFIDTMPDSLTGIYGTIDNFAQVSKFGGGMGIYIGKVRANGSTIRGFEGAAGGIIRWIRIINDTAVAVDQLGVRSGAVAVYLDVWHRDLLDFLNIRTNNGDDRMKAHDVFPALCYPDLFWKMAKENLDQDWYLMCPHEIYNVKGYHLEDYYGDEWEEKYFDCVHDSRITKKVILLKDLVRLILKSAVETGAPFAFNRDTVNKANPNKHKGIIYCSNLCTEIAQNMSESVYEDVKVVKSESGDDVIVKSQKPGDFVVCNLASLSLGHINVGDKDYLQHVIKTVIRALDNVISLNFYPVENAKLTCNKYRAIGLGVSGLHHLLAKKGIRWESEDHLSFVDKLFEEINFYSIKASCDIAKEKGKYSAFDGSEWQNGNYFLSRNYTSDNWNKLAAEVKEHGIRNGYILSIAPTASTSIISNTTPGIDPVMSNVFIEEKKGYMLKRVAPDMSPDTQWYYKAAHKIDQKWSVKSCGVRQRHIDQSQSMNLYITNEFTMRQVLDLYLLAWECGVKTVYYVRSKSLEIEECESCSS